MPDALNLEILESQISSAPISQIADIIRKNWKPVSPYAQPYLQAMFHLSSITDTYYLDSGESVVVYFLCNANTWRGPVARIVKKELNRRVKNLH